MQYTDARCRAGYWFRDWRLLYARDLSYGAGYGPLVLLVVMLTGIAHRDGKKRG
jgi:hypothetical protein